MENFKIYYDGELDKTEFAKRKASVIGGNILEGLSAYREQVARNTAETAGKIGQSLSAGIFDAFHGTDYRDQLHEQWEDERRTEFAGRIGLL